MGAKLLKKKKDKEVLKCTEVFDEVTHEVCHTAYHDECKDKWVDDCKTVWNQECHDVKKKKCKLVKEDKCIEIPVPFCEVKFEETCRTDCHVKWETKCHAGPDECESVLENQYQTHHEKVCKEVEEEECKWVETCTETKDKKDKKWKRSIIKKILKKVFKKKDEKKEKKCHEEEVCGPVSKNKCWDEPKEDLRHQEEAEVHSIPQEAVRGCVGSEMRQEAQKGMPKEDCAGMLACPIQGMRTCPSQEAKESLRS